MLQRLFHTDLILVHAPAVYDFRQETLLQGPLADVIPSTVEFEMYPVGFTSIAAYLERNDYNVRIDNLAYCMLRDEHFDVPEALAKLDATVFGLDLHWLPHAQGALAIAALLKELHPQSRILFGGLSASYYHEELIRYPFVDFVLRGDSTEEPARQLLAALRKGIPLENVDNLTWKRPDGDVVVNPLRFVPQDLDYVDEPDYRYAMRSAFKYIGLRNLIPYLEWPSYPTTMLLNARGCTQDCAICGGSRSAYRRVCGRAAPAYRSPQKLIEDVRAIRSFSRAPIFVVHDPRMGGMQRCRTFFRLLRAEQAPNPFCFELFFPAGDDFFDQLAGSVSSWSLEMSIESPDERLRRENGKFACSNAHIEATIDSALRHGCQKLDLFFMAGLPHQTYADVLATVDYCEGLARRFGDDRRLDFFISPLGPFLDPGSRAFEQPELGYRRLFPTLEAHRQAVLQPTWAQMLSFETDAMDSSTLVAATYDAAEGLNALKLRHGMIDEATYQNVKARSEIARSVLDEALRAEKLPQGEREEVYARLRDRVSLANAGTLCGVDELKWGSAGRFQLSPTLVRYLLQGFFMEIPHAVHRLFGRYDSAIYRPQRAPMGSLTAEVDRLETEPPPAAS